MQGRQSSPVLDLPLPDDAKGLQQEVHVTMHRELTQLFQHWVQSPSVPPAVAKPHRRMPCRQKSIPDLGLYHSVWLAKPAPGFCTTASG